MLSVPNLMRRVVRRECDLHQRMLEPGFNASWDGVRLRVDGCRLDQISLGHARGCFARRSVALVGDSLTRYQYLNLVHFLANGEWESPEPPNERERSHGSWEQFYATTNARMGGHEVCDCYRDQDRLETIVEHRYFIDGDVRVSYRQAFGARYPVAFHDLAALNVSSCESGRCAQGLCRPGFCRSAENKGPLHAPGVLAGLVRSFPTTDVFVNAGHWWPEGMDAAVLIAEAKNGPRGTAFHWKTTTASQGVRRFDERALAAALVDSGAFHGVFDAGVLTAGAVGHMWDDKHFEPAIYAGLNQALIAYVCSLG